MVATAAAIWSAIVMAAPPGGEGLKWTVAASNPSDTITAVRLTGTPYQMGWWYGNLLASEIRDNINKAIAYTGMSEIELQYIIDANLWPKIAPHIPQAFHDELQGIVDGAAEASPPASPAITLTDLRRIVGIVEFIGYECTSLCAVNSATYDGRLIQIRVLDTTLDSNAQDNPVITVYRPDDGPAYCNVGFAGVTGSLAGMNSEGVAMSEVGIHTPAVNPGDPSTFGVYDGIPMAMLIKRILAEAAPGGGQSALDKAVGIIQNASRTTNYSYGIGDAAIRDARSVITSRQQCHSWGTNTSVTVHRVTDPNTKWLWDPNDFPGTDGRFSGFDNILPAVPGVTYLPADVYYVNDKLQPSSPNNVLPLDVAKAQQIVRDIAMNHNLMDVVFDGEALKLWVTFAEGGHRAAEREFVEFDFGAQLQDVEPNPMTFSQPPHPGGPTSVTMQATEAQAGVGPVEYYFEQIGGGNSGWQSNRTYAATGLTPNTEYAFRVKARDASAPPRETAFSEAAEVWTLAAVPAAPELSNPTRQTVDLALAVDTNPAGTEYAIYDNTRTTYIDASGAASGAAVWRTRAAWGQITVTGLPSSTDCTFACKARNAVGQETALSPPATIRTLSDLTVVLLLTNATPTTVDVSITPSPSAPPTTTYAIRNETDGSWLAFDGSANSTAQWQGAEAWTGTTVTGLTPTQLYGFACWARTDQGEGESASNTATVCMPPQKPRQLIIESVTTTTAHARIDPNDGNPASTPYAIRNLTRQQWIDQDGLGYDHAIWRTAATWGTLKIAALSPGKAYQFDCQARNSTGSVTVASDPIAIAALAMLPRKLVVGSVSPTTVQLSIDPGDGNSDTTEYAIYDATRKVWVAQDGSVSAVPEWSTRAGWGSPVARGLYPNRRYSFYCKARNAGGQETEASETATALTLSSRPKMPIVDNPSTSTLDVTIDTNDDNPQSTEYALFDQKRSVWIDTDGLIQTGPQWHTPGDWGTVTVHSLGPGMEYSFVCRARNSAGIETADSPPGKGTTLGNGHGTDPNDTHFDAIAFVNEPTAINPTTVGMRASSDGNVPAPPVEYYFKEITGNAGGTSSGWTVDPLYVDSGLTPDTEYGYQVKGRDSATPPHETQYSQAVSVCTPAAIPAAPEIRSATRNTLILRLNRGENPSHTRLALYDQTRETYVDLYGDPVESPAWQTQAEWGLLTISGLSAGTEYVLVCKAINQEDVETDFSTPARSFTLPPDQTPPRLTGLTIQGLVELDEETSETYALTGSYSDGSSKPVTAAVTWRLSTAQWGVITDGVLNAHQVPEDKEVTIYADVPQDGHIMTASLLVRILNSSETTDPNKTDPNATDPNSGRPIPPSVAPGQLCPTTALVMFLTMIGGVLILRRRTA